jgi:excisionase family DNA binding protein
VKQPPATPSEVMTPAQVAQYLQVHKLTVYRYVREHELPAVRLGRSLRILKADVDEFLRLHRQGGSARGPIPKAFRRRQTVPPMTQTLGSEIHGHYQDPSTWSSPDLRSPQEDLLTWNLWDWVARGLH